MRGACGSSSVIGHPASVARSGQLAARRGECFFCALRAAHCALRARLTTMHPSMSLSPGSTVGPYQVLELLGEGGMGQVYRGRDPRLARDIAIKILPKDS